MSAIKIHTLAGPIGVAINSHAPIRVSVLAGEITVNTAPSSGPPGPTGAQLKLPAFSEYAETPSHFYFGWAAYNGGWLVRRQDRASGANSQATLAKNATKVTFANAWADRQALIFQTV